MLPLRVRCTTLVPFARPQLDVYEDRIEFRGRTWPLDEITHLWWDAQNVVINSGMFVTQDSCLKVFLRSEPRPLVFKQSKAMYLSSPKSSKLAEACDFIAERTFDQRLRGYLDQLETEGSFQYEKARFHADGTATARGKTYSLVDARCEGLGLSVRGRWGILVSTHLDYDVFSYLLRILQERTSAAGDLTAR
ncbi:MAG: hypothetical protein IPM29_23850 [Planctomycetes bacterium]|nr:hypothetical protein [Planctomycetota bacterium]